MSPYFKFLSCNKYIAKYNNFKYDIYCNSKHTISSHIDYFKLEIGILDTYL